MKKRVMSLALALSMVFGTSSYFEQSAVIEAAQITASAAAVPASLTYKKQYESDFSKHPEYIIITGYTGTLTELVIPDQIDGLPVVEISASAFKNAPNLKKITLPKKLVSCKKAFADCNNLSCVVVMNPSLDLSKSMIEYCIDKNGLYKKKENLILKGYKNSTAEQYAQKHSFLFVSLD